MTPKEIFTIADQKRIRLDRYYVELLSKHVTETETIHEILDKQINLSNWSALPELSSCIKDFIQKLLAKNHNLKKILDPCLIIGEMLNLVKEIQPNVEIHGYLIESQLFELNKIINPSIQLKLNSPVNISSEENDDFDLIISYLPFGKYKTIEPSIKGIQDISLKYLLKFLNLTNDNGIIITTINDSLLDGSDEFKIFLSHLNERGFCVSAIFGTPQNSFYKYITHSLSLIVIKRGSQEKIFQALISDDIEGQKRIVNNFYTGQASKIISEGVLVDIIDLRPINKIIERKDIDLLIKQTGLDLIKFKEYGLFKDIKNIKNEYLIFNRHSSKVELGSSDNINTKGDKYYFEIDQNKIDPSYLFKILTNGLAQKILINTLTGAYIPYLKKKSIEEMFIPIDSLPQQKIIVNIDQELDNTIQEFNNFKNNLWKNPKSVDKIKQEIKHKLVDPDSPDWMEKLPFPIASILWGHYSQSSNEKKIEYLFHFFEAFCEFINIIILSAFCHNQSYFDTTVVPWIANSESKDWYEKATFGGWRNLHEKLAKNIRTLLNDPKEKTNLINIFGGCDIAYLEMLCSKNIVTIFKNTNDLRNSYKGHGGAKNEDQSNDLLKILETQLLKTKGTIISGFSEVSFIMPIPKTLNYDEDTSTYSANMRILKGTKTTFIERELKINKPLDSKNIYIMHDNQFNPIKVIPLMQMRVTPETKQNACYFYNRVDKSNVRLISYHFAQENEIFEPVNSISSILDMLKTKD